MKNSILYEVFVRAASSSGHHHVGSLRAANDEEALLNARDLYARRNEGVSLWIVRSGNVITSAPNEQTSLFETEGKAYRYPAFYPVPKGVKNL
ncbi:MAG: 1,2-phenylacetyl-CoA epoxidase subunit B [Proteobacteria bacterium]|nr:1,2-phenylacetyl-CoA epoxidase subunit B [Pseudomonadota bacterium]